MSGWKLAAGGVVLSCCLAAAWGGYVQTTDGKTHEGSIRLENGQLVVRSPAGQDERLEVSAVRNASFVEEAPKRPDGAGLRCEYFGDTDLRKSVLVRLDRNIDFQYADPNSPDRLVPKDYSARWTGSIVAKQSGKYIFEAETDDGIRLSIDDRPVIDQWGRGGTFQSKEVTLQAGQPANFRLEFRDTSGDARAKLYWRMEKQGREIVPPWAFKPPPGSSPPIVRFTSPSGDTAIREKQLLSLEVDANDADGQVRRVDFYEGEKLLGTASAKPWRIEWKDIPEGEHRIVAKATDDSGMNGFAEEISVNASSGALAPPWSEAGKQSAKGSAKLAGSSFSLEARECEPWEERDGYYMVTQSLSGDATVVARLREFRPADKFGSAAGILILESRSRERSKQAFLGIMPDSGIAFVRREQEWEDVKIATTPGGAGTWLKLSRHGKLIKAWTSRDGKTWQSMGARQIEMRPNVYFGLMLMGPGKEPSQAEFDHVRVAPEAPAMASTLKGIILRSGSVIAGDMGQCNATSIKLWTGFQHVIVPTNQVARMMFRPVTEDMAAALEPGRTGILMANGDFLDASFVEYKDGQVKADSVLFGVRRYNVWEQVAVVAMNDLKSPAHACEVTLRNGSVLRAQKLSIEKDRLQVTDPSGVTLTMGAGELVKIMAK